MTLRKITLAALLMLCMLCMSGGSASAVEGLLPLNQTFTILSKTISYETATKEKWICGETKGGGTFESGSDIHGTGRLDFLKCEISGFLAFSLGDPEPKELKETLILEPVLFLICLINSTTLKFGVFLELTQVVHVHLKALGILLNLSGSFIAELSTIKGKLLILNVTGKEGMPSVTECKDSAGVVKKASLKEEKDPSTPVVESVNLEDGLLQFEKEVELMDS